MTEEQIEDTVCRCTDRIDASYMASAITCQEYEAEIIALNKWAEAEYERLACFLAHQEGRREMTGLVADGRPSASGEPEMTTYTIAYTSIEEDDGMSLLLAIVPDGADIDAAARLQIALSGLDEMKPCKYIVRTGLTLTDEEPQDTSRIVWEGGHDRGWLRDETGTAYVYALRTRPVMMFRPQGGSIWSVTIDGKFLDDYDTSEEVPMGEGGQCDLREVEKALRRAFNLGDDVECPVYP